MFFNKRIPSRLIVIILSATSCFLLFTIRLSLSVAIIAMVNQTLTHHEVDSESNGSDVCSSENNKTQVYQYHVSIFKYGCQTSGFVSDCPAFDRLKLTL